MRHEVACDNCGKQMRVSDERLLSALKNGICCEQCRRYIQPGTARLSQSKADQTVANLSLRKKTRRNAKRRKALASMKVGRVLTKGCDAAE